MLAFITGLVLLALLLFFQGLLKVYSSQTAKELKRQARRGDETSELLYRVSSYGMDVNIVLWFLIAITSTGLFMLLIRDLPIVLSFVLVLVLIWFIFAWLPASYTSRYMFLSAKYISPVLHWVLERAQPVLKKARHHAAKHQPIDSHSGLYEKEDLVELLDRQKKQADNRITREELTVAMNALVFADKKVSDVMTPKRMIKMVNTHDMVGPLLMDDLHKSGHSRFPVKHDSPDNIVGTLYLRDLVSAKAGGFVKDLMRKEVFYVNEAQNLGRVLDAFIKTKHHLFLVVNKFHEIVGVISIEDIIEQVLGRQVIDEFDAYDDLRAVAEDLAQKDSQKSENVIKSTNEKKKGESADSQ